MRKFLVVTAGIFALCMIVMFVHRTLTHTEASNATFIEQIKRDSRTVDAQWTWREVYPGRDTMEYALRLLQRSNENGYSRQLKVQQNPATIDWRTDSAPRWNGSVLADNNVPPPHVYAIVIRPPPYAVMLGDMLLTYGTPLNSPVSYGSTRNLCFEYGVCITIDRSQQSTRIFPYQAVKSITYMPTAVVTRSLSDLKWQGFRRY